MNDPQKTNMARQDLVVAFAAVLAVLVLAVVFDLSEKWHQWSTSHELWEIDELLLTTALSAGAFGWYAFRRWREYSAELQHRIAINERLAQEMEQRERVEEQLRQAQKMEAVGKLTGGIAHDFNNLLAVIHGNAEFLGDEVGSQHPSVCAIFRASARGAELAQRMLAFSRQQPLQPQSIDLADLVAAVADMLERTLGETIEVEIDSVPNLWPATADPGQVENVLLNLAINARDAMPEGGRLMIQCSNARLDEAYAAGRPDAVAGDYVVLAVSDNGVGMPAEVQEHAFEPFFTTKDVGEGSGLGLSMVYGFARQSGGHVIIYSEEGHGSTVKLYLPRDAVAVRKPEPGEATQTPRGSGETILLIEDDADVSEITNKMLRSLGYRVIGAPEAASARALLDDGATVDMVLSDVILPGGMSGPEFAEEAKTLYPDLKVIFMSGYPAKAVECDGLLGPDRVLLNKPFQVQQLATTLRASLETAKDA